MRSPWQNWLVFFLCVGLAVGAMGWLTHQALELDRAEAAARIDAEAARKRAESLQAQAEMEELISQALWRMDTALAPVLAQEAARPYFVYRPFYTAPSEGGNEGKLPSKGGKAAVSFFPSPLLQNSTQFVRLHFQLGPANRLASPQCPIGRERDRALELGIEPAELDQSADQLVELSRVLKPAELLACLPEQRLPELYLGEYAFDVNANWNFRLAQNGNRFNAWDQGQGQQSAAVVQPNAPPHPDPPQQQPEGIQQSARPADSPPPGPFPPQPLPQQPTAPTNNISRGPGPPANPPPLEQTLDSSQYDVPARNSLNGPGYYVNRNPDQQRNNERNYVEPRGPQAPPAVQSEAQSPTTYVGPQVAQQGTGRQGQGQGQSGAGQQVVPNHPEVNSGGQEQGQTGLSPSNVQPNAYGTNTGNTTNTANLDNDLRLQNSRSGGKFEDRSRIYQTFAQQALVQQRKGNDNREPGPQPQLQVVSEGVSRPVWVGNELLLARRVKIGEDLMIQGCWIDWAGLKEQLLADVADLVPGADLVPVIADTSVPLSRLLATLPARIALPPPPPVVATAAAVIPVWESPVKIALWIAWPCLVLAAGAIAALLLGVVSLSERRAAFVAAVTHELRTPLTTFRMYAEMLADGMVSDEARKQQYLETLRVEADRLSHLVENVLLYARLERGPGEASRQNLSLAALLDRSANRLRDRAKLAGMELVIAAGADAKQATVRTDPVAVEQILFNLVDNACKYAADATDKRLHLDLASTSSTAQFRVRDHGPGLSRDASARLFEPFSKSAHEAAVSAPGVGLGLALSKRLATDLGGDLVPERCEEGAAFVLTLPRIASPER